MVGVAVTPRRNPGLGDLTTNSGRVFRTLLFTGTMLVVTPFTFAQSKQTGLPEGELPEESRIIAAHEIPEVRLVVVARGLSHPWSLAFLPGGDMLITERGGRLRMVRDGVLVAEPVSGLPTDIDASDFYSGLMDVAIHPEFARNRLVYLTYTRALDRGETVVLVRGRLEGMALTSVEEIFVASLTGGDPNRPVHDSGSRLAFAPDGTLFMTIGGAFEGDYPGDPKNADLAQNLASHAGKLLRLNADGSPPDDNPFVDEADSLPEIYSLRHRNQMGLALHPETGQPFATEHGMQGGDELNAIEPGGNYGWPLVTYGRRYDGRRVERVWQEGLQEPVVFWVPSIAPSGLTFYDGDRFPAWKGNVFTGAMRVGRIARTGHLQRIVLGETGGELRRESLLGEFRQRIRDVRQGPDGLLYLLTDGQDPAGRAYQPALLRLEPVSR